MLARDGPHGPVVHAACEAAAARGVRPEGRVVDAQAIHPDLRVEPADVAGDLASLDRLVFWARRWCPWTARDGHDGIVLDATGAAHLFGGEAGLLEDVVARFAAHALTARVAMAPTRLAARALARHGPASVACDARDVADRLAPLPVAALGLGPEPARLLARLGLRTVGALAGVPRTALMRRFADAPAEDNPLAALDRALGRTADPVAAPPDHARRIVRSRMAEPVADVLPHLPDLARRLCAMLETAGLGARTLTLSVRRSDGAEGAVDAATARATRDPAHVERLLRGKLDRIDPGFGIDLVALEARRVEPLGARQDGLDGGRDADADVAALLDRLTARLGPDRVSWSLWSESHLPERVERRAPALAAIPRPPARHPRRAADPAPRRARGDRGRLCRPRGAARPLPLAPRGLPHDPLRRPRADRAGMVARARRHAAARLLQGRGRGRPAVLDLPRGGAGRRARRRARLVPARLLRLMPLQEGHPRRTLSEDGNGFRPHAPGPYVELGLASCFSFLHAASDACDLMGTANRLGYDAVGIADRNTLAGVVRVHCEARTAHVRPLIGARLVLACGAELLAYPRDRAAYARLSVLLSKGKMEGPRGEWQQKGETHLTLDMLARDAEGLHLVAMPGADLDRFEAALPRLARALPGMRHVGAAHLYRGDDRARINRLDALARRHGRGILATNDVLYHHPSRRPLQDVMTCIREGVTVDRAGFRLLANAERHLKPPAEMCRLFADWPHAVAATRALADDIAFALTDLRYEYPHEIVPEGRTAQGELERLAREGAARRYPDGVPDAVRAILAKEFALIASKGIARYFLTIHDIVRFAREGACPSILCQGRGSAANSAVCFCLGITSVDPDAHEVLFERFLSEERDEPPDIDVDFEHERREEVIQYIYRRYGRDRAGLCATVIHYRPRSAIREVGKAMGLSEDVTSRLAGTIWGSFEGQMDDDRAREAGLDLSDPHLRRVLALARQMIGMPRHLSQHVGGFVLTERPLTELVPIGNGAMPERSFIEWDKDDIDALGIFKVDILALGMLTCIAKGFALIAAHHGRALDLATVPIEDHEDDATGRPTYDMLCRGDSLGVFQVESRAQMAMLPKLRPRVFYDLVIEVAIVRPGPIQGDMVHPYLRRRRREEPVVYPAPGPEHPQDELLRILGRTLGVPIFQEQAMKIAMDAARFTPAESNALRRAMATFRSRGTIDALQQKMVGRMTERGYDPAFAQRCFDQIKGFGEYGFPESHAASFAKLVYVSSWLKCHYPAAFACALLNSQPMGFYAPAQIVRDARDHGVAVRDVDVGYSDWDCTLEPDGVDPHGAPRFALRLGLRLVDGLGEAAAARVAAARDAPFADVADLKARTGLDRGAVRRLAAADAMRSMGLDRRAALWQAQGLRDAPALPIFEHAGAAGAGPEAAVALPAMRRAEHVVADYQTLRLSLKAHPMQFFRASLRAQGFRATADLARLRHGARASLAGLVLVRQKPGSAKGVCFVTLEDEAGVANLVIWPAMFKAHRATIMAARLLVVHGRVQTDGTVIHVVADDLEDRSARLDDLSADRLPGITTRGDHPTHPIPGQVGIRGHPRDARTVPKSRDFH